MNELEGVERGRNGMKGAEKVEGTENHRFLAHIFRARCGVRSIPICGGI